MIKIKHFHHKLNQLLTITILLFLEVSISDNIYSGEVDDVRAAYRVMSGAEFENNLMQVEIISKSKENIDHIEFELRNTYQVHRVSEDLQSKIRKSILLGTGNDDRIRYLFLPTELESSFYATYFFNTLVLVKSIGIRRQKDHSEYIPGDQINVSVSNSSRWYFSNNGAICETFRIARDRLLGRWSKDARSYTGFNPRLSMTLAEMKTDGCDDVFIEATKQDSINDLNLEKVIALKSGQIGILTLGIRNSFETLPGDTTIGWAEWIEWACIDGRSYTKMSAIGGNKSSYRKGIKLNGNAAYSIYC